MKQDWEFHYRVLNFLGRLREESTSQDEQQYLDAAMAALDFISRTGQTLDFDTFRESVEGRGPPIVIAAFETQESAEAWLRSHPNPPSGAQVLVAGEYRDVRWEPGKNRRHLLPVRSLENYLRGLIDGGLPAPVASFATLEEARAWTDSQPEPPRQAVIEIAGEFHLVAYHPRINLRAIYPFSRAAEPK
jgi:hypothetical protein